MHRKMEETLHGNCTCSQPPFSSYRTGLTGKQSAPFERALNSGPEMTSRFSFPLYLYMITALEGRGNTYEPYSCAHAKKPVIVPSKKVSLAK
jgi:hypothetical protein